MEPHTHTNSFDDYYVGHVELKWWYISKRIGRYVWNYVSSSKRYIFGEIVPAGGIYICVMRIETIFYHFYLPKYISTFFNNRHTLWPTHEEMNCTKMRKLHKIYFTFCSTLPVESDTPFSNLVRLAWIGPNWPIFDWKYHFPQA